MALDFREPFPSRYFLFLYSQLLAHMECCQNFCGGKLKAFLSSQERRGEVGELLLGGRKVFSLPVSYLLHFLMHEFSSLLCGCCWQFLSSNISNLAHKNTSSILMVMHTQCPREILPEIRV